MKPARKAARAITRKTGKRPEPRRHARFAPSAAHRWMSCTASIPLIESLGLDKGGASSDYADEGTAAHSIHEKCLKENLAPSKFLGSKVKVNGKAFTVDAEMVDALEISIDYLREIERSTGGTLHVESDVFIPEIGDDGHPDAYIVAPMLGELHVGDFKYGKGHVVEAAGNEQMRLYALGVLALLVDPTRHAIDSITVHVMQPRAPHDHGPCRSHTYTRDEMEAFAEQVIVAKGNIEKGDVTHKPSESACVFCPAKAHCPALAEEATKAAFSDFADFMEADPGDGSKDADAKAAAGLNLEQLAGCMARLPLLFMWANAVEIEVGRRIAAGKDVPGFKLVEGKSNRRWRDEGATIARLVKLGLALDKVAPRKLEGIKAIESMVPRPARDKFMDANTEKPPGKPTIVKEADKRPALNMKTAAEDFAEFIGDTE